MKQIGKYVILKEEEARDIAKAFSDIFDDAASAKKEVFKRIDKDELIPSHEDGETLNRLYKIGDLADMWIKRITWRR